MHGINPQRGHQYTRILALDLGKFNSVLCDFAPATAGHRFQSLASTPAAIHDLLAPLSGADPASVLVVMETCDTAGWVHDIAVALGLSVAIANPSNEAWRWTRVKRKTDRDDALKLARMADRNELPTVHMPSPQQRQRRRLVHHRRVLVQRRTQVKNQVRSVYSQQGLLLPRGSKCWTKIGIAQIKVEARSLSRCSVDELWRGRLHVELQLLAALNKQIALVDKRLDALAADDPRAKLLQSVPGVGPRLAETVLVHLDDPHRFTSAAAVGSYAGLVPKQFESGTMKRAGRITRRGPALLRGMLTEVAWMVYMRSPWARAFVQRVSRGMKSRKRIAIVALARKLLVRLWAMLRDNQPWREPGESNSGGSGRRNNGEDRGHTADGCGCSPPEDTAARKPVSSVAVALLGAAAVAY
jgi:transposase